MGGTKGDLDPNMYKMSHDKPGSQSTVGGLSKEEKKWSNVQQVSNTVKLEICTIILF